MVAFWMYLDTVGQWQIMQNDCFVLNEMRVSDHDESDKPVVISFTLYKIFVKIWNSMSDNYIIVSPCMLLYKMCLHIDLEIDMQGLFCSCTTEQASFVCYFYD